MKKVYLKSWVETLLKSVLVVCFMLMVCIDDATSILGLIMYEIILGVVSYLIIKVLNKYGKEF